MKSDYGVVYHFYFDDRFDVSTHCFDESIDIGHQKNKLLYAPSSQSYLYLFLEVEPYTRTRHHRLSGTRT
jgi:hypothetical protein